VQLLCAPFLPPLSSGGASLHSLTMRGPSILGCSLKIAAIDLPPLITTRTCVNSHAIIGGRCTFLLP
jgi:hypothetical protein